MEQSCKYCDCVVVAYLHLLCEPISTLSCFVIETNWPHTKSQEQNGVTLYNSFQYQISQILNIILPFIDFFKAFGYDQPQQIIKN